MKIIAFTDIHTSVTAFKRLNAKVKKENPDYVFCLGDFTVFGQHTEEVIRKISELKKPVILIHGNHEDDVIVRKICKRYPNITFAHRKIIPINKYTVVAHGGGGFYGQGKKLAGDKDFDRFIKKNKTKLKGKLIFLTHAPPAHTKLDYIEWMDDHVGCKSYGDFIKKYKPAFAFSGHLHENFKMKEKKGKTLLCNPGPEGMVFRI